MRLLSFWNYLYAYVSINLIFIIHCISCISCISVCVCSFFCISSCNCWIRWSDWSFRNILFYWILINSIIIYLVLLMIILKAHNCLTHRRLSYLSYLPLIILIIPIINAICYDLLFDLFLFFKSLAIILYWKDESSLIYVIFYFFLHLNY